VQDAEVVVKLPVEPRLEAGTNATFSVPRDKVLLFDRETERALGSAA
jgi:hypothetical protein